MSRVLIAEDDRDLRWLLAEELEGLGPLLFAESGDEAIRLLASMSDIAAVISDLDLGPGPSGFDVLRAARERNPRCVRVLVTARRGVTMDGEASELVQSFFGKPWVFGSIHLYLKARFQ